MPGAKDREVPTVEGDKFPLTKTLDNCQDGSINKVERKVTALI